MIMAQKQTTRAYCKLMIFIAIRRGLLPVYPRSLRYGTRHINLYNPDEVEKWIQKHVRKNIA